MHNKTPDASMLLLISSRIKLQVKSTLSRGKKPLSTVTYNQKDCISSCSYIKYMAGYRNILSYKAGCCSFS